MIKWNDDEWNRLALRRAVKSFCLANTRSSIAARRLAVPVTQVQATATIEPGEAGLTIHAADIDQTRVAVEPTARSSPLAAIVNLTLEHLNCPLHDLKITIHSTIPIASGLGSGAAVSTAIVRALAQWARRTPG